MKIGNSAENPVALAQATGQAAAADAAKPQAATPAQPGAGPDESAKVKLSSTAAALLSTGASADFDADKVARISKAIEDGTFQVNPEVIADKLLSNAQELLSQNQR